MVSRHRRPCESQLATPGECRGTVTLRAEREQRRLSCGCGIAQAGTRAPGGQPYIARIGAGEDELEYRARVGADAGRRIAKSHIPAILELFPEGRDNCQKDPGTYMQIGAITVEAEFLM